MTALALMIAVCLIRELDIIYNDSWRWGADTRSQVVYKCLEVSHAGVSGAIRKQLRPRRPTATAGSCAARSGTFGFFLEERWCLSECESDYRNRYGRWGCISTWRNRSALSNSQLIFKTKTSYSIYL